MPSQTRVLLTGATGFIGRATLDRLLQLGADVAVVSRRPALVGGRVQSFLLPGQGSDPDGWLPLVTGVGTVVHLAGRAHVLRERSADPLAEFRRVNVDLSVTLARAAASAGVRRFVFVSSIGVLGERTTEGAPFSERSAPAPVAAYAISKHEAEVALADIARASGMELVIVRPPLVHGPGAPGNFDRLLRLVARGWPLPLGGLDNRRSFIGVTNLARLLAAVALRGEPTTGPIVPADAGAIGSTQLVRWMAEDLGVPLRLVTVPGLSGLRRLPILGGPIGKLVDSLEVDGGPSWGRLGLAPDVSLREGLREMSLHYRDSYRSG